MFVRMRVIVAAFLIAIAVIFGIASFSNAATVTTSPEQLPELMRRVPVTKWDSVWIQFQYGDHEYGLAQSWVLSRGFLTLRRQGGEWLNVQQRDAEFSALITEIGRFFSAGLVERRSVRAYDALLWYGAGDDTRILRNRQRFPYVFDAFCRTFTVTMVQVELPDGTKLRAPFTVE